MKNLDIDIKEMDGGIFLSQNNSGICLKRWYKEQLPMLKETLIFFDFCRETAEDLDIEDVVIVPRVYERGDDFVMMDYDASAISIAEKVPTAVQQAVLDKLLAECDREGSIYSQHLKRMIQQKSTFVRISFTTGNLVIAGLEILEEKSTSEAMIETKTEPKVDKPTFWSRLKGLWS